MRTKSGEPPNDPELVQNVHEHGVGEFVKNGVPTELRAGVVHLHDGVTTPRKRSKEFIMHA